MGSSSYHRVLKLEPSEVSVASAYPLTVWETGHEFLLYFYISIPVLAARKRDSYNHTTHVCPFLEFAEETLREGIEEWGLGEKGVFSSPPHPVARFASAA
jgi:hypothetical protein